MVLTDAARKAADVVGAGLDMIAVERKILLDKVEAERSHVLGALSAKHALARSWLGGERKIVLTAVADQVRNVDITLSEMIAWEILRHHHL